MALMLHEQSRGETQEAVAPSSFPSREVSKQILKGEIKNNNNTTLPSLA